jgi:hypothetical protein
MATKRWADMSPVQRKAIVALSAVEMVLTATAAADLYRRPQSGLRGPKALWWAGIFIQPVGPVAYLTCARR